jgi:hypothetical protein
MDELIHKAESFKIIGVCMEVHCQLGKGHNEMWYCEILEHLNLVHELDLNS